MSRAQKDRENHNCKFSEAQEVDGQVVNWNPPGIPIQERRKVRSNPIFTAT